jgi:hypothetical protein
MYLWGRSLQRVLEGLVDVIVGRGGDVFDLMGAAGGVGGRLRGFREDEKYVDTEAVEGFGQPIASDAESTGHNRWEFPA